MPRNTADLKTGRLEGPKAEEVKHGRNEGLGE